MPHASRPCRATSPMLRRYPFLKTSKERSGLQFDLSSRTLSANAVLRTCRAGPCDAMTALFNQNGSPVTRALSKYQARARAHVCKCASAKMHV
eukprot:1397518-Alexandrium_andersonii.AAC.1